MSTGGQYVAAAYAVVLFGLLLYAVVVGLRNARIAREAEVLARIVERETPAASGTATTPEPARAEPSRGAA